MKLLLLIFFAFLFISANASRIPLIDRDDELPSSLRFEARMRRDALRVATLYGKPPTDIRTNVYGYGQYIVKVGVGSPAVNRKMVVDTGSDLVWVKCGSCVGCYNPDKSSSLHRVACDSDTCKKIDEDNRKKCKNENNCIYRFEYGDESYTEGSLVLETITIGTTSVTNVTMGCSQASELTSGSSADGLLGLGRGSLSLVSQWSGQIGGAFTYCLNGQTGWLDFGRSNFPTNARWSSMISNPNYPSFYYIDLLDITVGGETANIPGGTFTIDRDSGEGGVILDSGTSMTLLPSNAYIPLRDKFKEKIGNLLNPTNPQSIFDTCYSISVADLEHIQLPIVSFIISSNGFGMQDIIVNASNVLIDIDGISTMCFGFAPTQSDTGMSIIGGTQQNGIQIIFDSSLGHFGFGPDC